MGVQSPGYRAHPPLLAPAAPDSLHAPRGWSGHHWSLQQQEAFGGHPETQEAPSRWDSSGQSTLSPWVADVRADFSQASLHMSRSCQSLFPWGWSSDWGKGPCEEGLEITMPGGYWGHFILGKM